MSEVKKGSEITSRIIDECDRLCVPSLNKAIIKDHLKDTVVVPEEKWKELERMLYFEYIMEGDVIIPLEKWQRIKTLIENQPKVHFPKMGGNYENFEDIPVGELRELIASYSEYREEETKWFEELRKEVIEK